MLDDDKANKLINKLFLYIGTIYFIFFLIITSIRKVG